MGSFHILPLIFCVGLVSIRILSSKRRTQFQSIFVSTFAFACIGSIVVGLNAKLMGCKMYALVYFSSYLQTACLLGYSALPIVVAAVLSLITDLISYIVTLTVCLVALVLAMNGNLSSPLSSLYFLRCGRDGEQQNDGAISSCPLYVPLHVGDSNGPLTANPHPCICRLLNTVQCSFQTNTFKQVLINVFFFVGPPPQCDCPPRTQDSRSRERRIGQERTMIFHFIDYQSVTYYRLG